MLQWELIKFGVAFSTQLYVLSLTQLTNRLLCASIVPFLDIDDIDDLDDIDDIDDVDDKDDINDIDDVDDIDDIDDVDDVDDIDDIGNVNFLRISFRYVYTC